MCNADCCCRDASASDLIKYLLVFVLVNLLLSFISIFIRAAQTERYDQALLYLDAINSGELDLNLAEFGFNNCDRTGDFLDTNYYCEINGKRLKQPSESVSNQDLFKKWNTVELILSISRTVLTVGFVAFFYFIIKKKADDLDLDNKEDKKNFLNSLSHLNIFIIFLIVISGIWILIRALALTANDDIGLYEDGEQNAFEEKIAINYIFDIGEIVLYGISICFVLRIKRDLNRPPPSPNNIQTKRPRVNITPVTIQNPPPPQNPYPRPQPNGRPRLQPIGIRVEERHVRIIQVEQVNSVQQLDRYNYH